MVRVEAAPAVTVPGQDSVKVSVASTPLLRGLSVPSPAPRNRGDGVVPGAGGTPVSAQLSVVTRFAAQVPWVADRVAHACAHLVAGRHRRRGLGGPVVDAHVPASAGH